MSYGKAFRKKLNEFLRNTPISTPEGEISRNRVDVQFGYHGGAHEPTRCWEYRRAGTQFRMLFSFYSNFSPDDLICIVLTNDEEPQPTAGATIQFNSYKCVDDSLRLSHGGVITAGTKRSRQDLLDAITAHAAATGAQLGLTGIQDWPLELGSPADCAALLDQLFLYVYAVEQAKRFFRGKPLLPNWSHCSNPARLLTEEQLAADTEAIQIRTDIGDTEKKQLINARRGQGKFRQDVCAMWNNKCAVGGCGLTELLRASHIKPWRSSTDAERLDPYNGLLLTPNFDAAFDAGLISFSDHGDIIFSSRLSKTEARTLGFRDKMRVPLKRAHRKYLKHHRDECLQD